jgi:hypothetical protein
MQNDVTFAVITAVLLKIQLWRFVVGRVVGDVSGVSFCFHVGSKKAKCFLNSLTLNMKVLRSSETSETT